LELLRARSLIAIHNDTETNKPPVPIRPDQGHDTARLAVYYGRSDNDTTFTDLYLRPSYHDLMDPDAGYQYGAQINFFDFHIRSQQNTGSLEDFTLIDIVSLTPRSRFFSPLSWHVSTGLERFNLPHSDERPLVFNVRGGAGFSYSLTDNQLASFMLDTGLLAENKLPEGYALALGPSLRWLWSTPDSNWRFQLRSSLLRYYIQVDRDEVEHQFQTNLRLTRDMSLRFSYKIFGEPANTTKELRLGLNWYF
jgi:hypothetical protein